MPATDRRYTVGLGVGAADASVLVVVVRGQGVRCRGGCCGSGGRGYRYHHVRRRAAVQHGVCGVGLALVDSQPVFQAGLDDAVHVPALIEVWKTLGRVLVRLLMPVDGGRG